MTRRIRFTPFARAGVFTAGLALAASGARASDVPFVTQPPISVTANGAYSVFVADVDGDGDLDALSASFFDGKIAWYENTAGNGSAWTLRTISTASGALSVFAADVDGDGDMDALSASAGDDKIAWYENTAGNGSAWTLRTITVVANEARSVFAADVDGDGDVDVLSASSLDDKVAWYENTAGNGTAWTLRTISVTGGSARSVFAADVDGDGDMDALSGNQQAVAWYENTAGNGSAWTLHTISVIAGARPVLAADVDGDGDMDALSGNNLTVTWHENTAGNGSAWTLHTISLTGNDAARSVFAADVDGDGDMDALSAFYFNQAIVWYENALGNGSAWTRRTISSAANGAGSAFAADVDGDGDMDALSASAVDDKIAWYRNDTIHASACHAPAATVSTTANGARSVFAADLDGDGDNDALSASAYDDKVAWYENAAGNGSAWTLRTISLTATGAESVFAADVDGDGDEDALSASALDDKVAWHENTAGNGTAWTLRTISLTASGARSVRAADIDGDGDIDALSASLIDGKIAWYDNAAGNGTAWTLRTISLAASGAVSVFAADVDGDGDMDVLSASYFDDKLAWYENTAGNGTAWTLRTISLTADGAYSVFAADVDGDGDMDALSASFSDDKVAWYENTAGNGTVWTLRTISVAANGASAVLAADMDRDGDLDVLSASQLDDTVAWYENTAGNGTAWTAHTTSTTAEGASAVFAADLDGDSDLDTLSASLVDDRVAWHENQGGQFSVLAADTAPPGAMNGELVAVLRIDAVHQGRAGDGDLELARFGLLFEESAGDPLTIPEANALIESLQIYRDLNGNGVFDPGVDTLVITLANLTLNAGVQIVPFTDGDPNVQVAHGGPVTYFVVAELTANANTQSPNQFRVTHLGTGGSASTAEDRTYDIPLRPACPANVASSVVGPVTPVELIDFEVE